MIRNETLTLRKKTTIAREEDRAAASTARGKGAAPRTDSVEGGGSFFELDQNPNPRRKVDEEGRTYLVFSPLSPPSSRGQNGKSIARRWVTGARDQGANARPLDGDALTHWGARTSARGPVAASHSLLRQP